MTIDDAPRLRQLPGLARLGLLGLTLVLLGGMVASAAHLWMHHEGRDERPGLTIDDVRGAYHGVQSTAPLLTALDRNHPPELSESARTTLRSWLESDRVSEDYDNLDLGDAAPAEIIARSCLECHTRNADDDIGQVMPLEYWDDIKALAFSREINPTGVEVLAASTHAHALSMGALSVVVALLAWLTCWPRWLMALGIAAMGVALLIDMGSWWLARDIEAFVWGIVVGGGVYNGATVALLLAVLVDLVLPSRR